MRRTLSALAITALLPILAPATATARTRSCPTPRDYPAGWHRLAQLESSGRWHIHGLFDGGLQHTVKTWRAFRHCAGVTATRAHLATPEQQIAVARFVLGGQGPCAWPLSSYKLGVASCGYGR